jgi:hypothetical protein
MAEGLVGGEGFAADASLIKADANKQRSAEASDAAIGGNRSRWIGYAGSGSTATVEECGLAVLSDADPVLDLARADDRVKVFRRISLKVRDGG